MNRILFGLLILFTGCDEDTDSAADSGTDTDSRDGLSETGTALETCSMAPIDSVDISNVAISGDALSLDVSYSGGCESHRFRLCWDGAVMESSPPQVNVTLIHDANMDACEAYITDGLSFDLSSAGLPSGEVIINFDGESLSYDAP